MSGFWSGPGLMLVSGVMNGSFALPMRWARKWEWENTWLVFSAVALVALPAAIAFALIPNLGETYRSLSLVDLLPALGFGLLWGVGQATFGIPAGACRTPLWRFVSRAVCWALPSISVSPLAALSRSRL